ncbi:DUF6288 domain-containing protein [bacterium]|nr:DUF6288 domain-containing protein [bacterium]
MVHLRTCLLLVLPLLGAAEAAAQRNKPAVPDLTAGDERDDKHDWNLGPTGARGWIWGWKLETTDARQVLVTEVAEGSPAEGKLQPGDVIVGVGSGLFTSDPRVALGLAIGAAESAQGKGRLDLRRWRKGKVKSVRIKLPVLGEYESTAPFNCAKSRKVLDAACDHIAANMKGGIDGMVNALALLANGDRRHAGAVRDLARKVGRPDTALTLEGRTSGLLAWEWGYRAVFLCEYFIATKDRQVLPAIAEYAGTIARGQSRVGTWGHGMAWPDLNDGELHGSLGGYGAVNQAGLVCHLALVLAEECGVKDREISEALQRANQFARFYTGKGAIPYGDHRPGWDSHDDNGKNSLAALIFDLQGMDEEATFFGRMAVASYDEREQGHTGNYFSFLWGPIGANRLGEEAVSAFLREQRWYYDLARANDGSFPYQGGAGMSGGEHKYGKWDCTGAFVLANTFHKQELFITGRGVHKKNRLVGDDLADTIEAGRGFDSWSKGADHFANKRQAELMRDLKSWSPAVRSRAAKALASSGDTPTAALRTMLKSRQLDVRYGACQAISELGGKAAAALPELRRCLQSDDVWLRIQAAYALSAVGNGAREAIPDMLELALLEDEEDPREITQRYMAFCLFYPGGALGMRGLLSKDLGDLDRSDLLPVIERLLINDDGRARGAMGTIFKLMTLEELKPLLPQLVEAVRTPSPSGVMFSNGVRLAGLDFLAANRVTEGMELCILVTEIDKWGKQDRILRCMKALQEYGGAARPVLPQLRDLEDRLRGHREARNLEKQIKACTDTIDAIETARTSPEVRTVAELMALRRSRR